MHPIIEQTGLGWGGGLGLLPRQPAGRRRAGQQEARGQGRQQKKEDLAKHAV